MEFKVKFWEGVVRRVIRLSLDNEFEAFELGCYD